VVLLIAFIVYHKYFEGFVYCKQACRLKILRRVRLPWDFATDRASLSPLFMIAYIGFATYFATGEFFRLLRQKCVTVKRKMIYS